MLSPIAYAGCAIVAFRPSRYFIFVRAPYSGIRSSMPTEHKSRAAEADVSIDVRRAEVLLHDIQYDL